MDRLSLISCAILTLVVTVSVCMAEVQQAPAGAVVGQDPPSAALRSVLDEGIPSHTSQDDEMSQPNRPARPRSLSAQGNDVTCPAASEGNDSTAEVEMGEYTLQASFACAEALTTISPADNDGTKCLAQPADSQGTPIKTVLGVDGSFKRFDSTQRYTVTLNKMPDRKKVMYYKCSDGNSKTCTVTVRMPKKPDPNVCTLDGTVQLDVDAPQEVKFLCNGGTAELHPAADKRSAYKGTSCEGNTVLLNTLLQGSSIKNDEGTYTLNVPSLPEEKTQLCFRCVHKNVPQLEKTVPERVCKVLVSVAAAPPTTTTTQPTGAATTGPARFWFLAAFTAVSALAV